MIRKGIMLLVLGCLFVLTTAVYANRASQIIKKSEAAIRGNTQVAIIKVTIQTRRWRRSMTLKSYENRLQRKSFTEIIAPKKDAGNRFLLIRQSMKHFVPKLQRVIKISPSMMLQSWMGSDFSNDDIVKESSIFEDYTHSLAGKHNINGHMCHKVVLTPKPKAAVVWGKIVYYARVKDYLPVKEEFYNQRNVLKKIMTFSRFKFKGGRMIPTRYKMITVKKRNRFTMMDILRVRYNLRIPRRIFTLQNLKRR